MYVSSGGEAVASNIEARRDLHLAAIFQIVSSRQTETSMTQTHVNFDSETHKRQTKGNQHRHLYPFV